MRDPKNSTILVIQTAFVGDIALATSFFAGLRSLAPEARIVAVTTPAGAQLLQPNPWRVEIISYDKRGRERGMRAFWRKCRELRALNASLVFCLHRSFRSSFLAFNAGGESYGFAEAAGAFLLDHKVKRAGKLFEAEKNLALLEAWSGQSGFSPFPVLQASEEEKREARALLGGEKKFVALAPSSVWATKRWPPERFAWLANEFWRKYGLRSVIVGGRESYDIDLGRALSSACAADIPAPLDLSGKTSLGQLKAVLEEAEFVVANDSAPLHFAIAMGTKTLGIYGPTTRELGFFPLSPEKQSAAVELAGLSCRPCGLHGHQACPQKHFRCMLDLSPEKVFAEAEKLLCP